MLSLLMCAVMLMGMVLIPPAEKAEAASLSQLQANLNSLKQQQAALDSKLASLKNQTSSQKAYLEQLNQKITNAQSQIDNLNAQISMYDAQIAEKEVEISKAEDQIDADYETLKRRLKALYMMGEASLIGIVLSADSVEDYFNKAEYVASIVKHDNDIIQGLKDRTNEIRNEMKEIDTLVLG